jgi:hypothetical protein
MIRALVIALMVVATPLASCHSVAEPRTVAEARPELAVAYEAGMRAWVWLDARNAALYEARAEMVTAAILDQRAAFEAECGDAAPQCMLAVFDQVMAEWADETGYDARLRRLEVARQGLEAMRAVLASDPEGGTLSWAPAVLKTIGALSALVEELKASKVGVPEVVSVGLSALRRLA